MAELSITLFKNAVAELAETIDFAERHKAKDETSYFTKFRTAAIQSFEYCYDIGQKLIRRQIESADIFKDENRHQEYRDYARIAAEYGIIDNPEDWVGYRAWRNETSHTYDEKLAKDLYALLPAAVKSFQYTIEKLEEKSGASK